MKAFIWDLDGTLLNSYEEVVSSVELTLKEYGIEKDEAEILDYSIKYSVKDFFMLMEVEYGILCDELYHRFHEIQDTRYILVKEEPGAAVVLSELVQRGVKNFVFTHRNKIAFLILEKLGLLSYFEEVATLDQGFKRKPDPDGLNYLINKYQLNKKTTYYVGDRNIDMECARQAGLRRILYSPGTNPETLAGSEEFRITTLEEILRFADMDKKTSELQFVRLEAEDIHGIQRMSAMATEIVREHFDPVIGKAQNDYMLQKFQTAEAIAEQLKQGYQYYFIYRGDIDFPDCIGFVAFYPRGDMMYISKFYLYREERGKGYSHNMLEFVIQHARAQHCKGIELNVNRNNSACRAYEKLGFRIVREEKNDIGNGFYMDDYVYSVMLENEIE